MAERTSRALGGESLLPRGESLLPTGTGGETTPNTGSAGDAEEGKGFITRSLPFFTEASFFGLVGFALGYFSRKVVKLMLIFIALIFVAIQGLSYGGVITVDWSRLIEIVNGFILNLKQNDTISEVLRDRIPTAGALVAGYAFGFRKG